MQRRLELTGEHALADGLGHALGAMMQEAEAQARAAVEDPASALHEYRRAIRRAQAVVALTAPMLRKRQRKQLAVELRRATRRTRTLRDLDAVMPVLGKLESNETDAVGAAELAALRAYLEAAATEIAGSEITAWRLRKNVRAIAGLGAIFRAGLHGWVEDDMLLDSLRDHYKVVRNAWKAAVASDASDDLHAWRRAARTLRYQLELLASRPGASPGLVALRETFEDQVKQLGQVTDLLALAGLVRTADPELLGTDPDALVERLRAIAAARSALVMSEAEAVFAVKPKSFAWPVEAEAASASAELAHAASPASSEAAKPTEGAAASGQPAAS
ncbi:MAG: CHAD domain-containing protein [Myxococcota bacterium]